MEDTDSPTWLEWFIGCRGNEYLCQVDEEFITDRFNLTGIGHDIPQFKKAYELITGDYSDLDDGEIRSVVEKSAKHVYGLIHSRFIITSVGLERMKAKYDAGIFGTCPRVFCDNTKLLPLGLSDLPNIQGVKLFCPNCEDVYCPKSARHASIDGSYFGTSFPHLFLQPYPHEKKEVKKYTPKIFGFCIADRSRLASTDENMMTQ